MAAADAEDYDFIYAIGYQDGLLDGAAKIEDAILVLLEQKFGDLSETEALIRVSHALGFFPLSK